MTSSLIALVILSSHIRDDAVAPGVTGAMEPRGSFLKDGRMIVAFATKQAVLVVQEKSDGGFGAPVLKLETPGLMAGMRRGPRIAVTGNNVIVTFPQQSPTKRFRADLYAVTSNDSGATWSDKVRVNDVEGCAPEGLDGLCAFGKSGVAAVWLDHRGDHTEIWASVSKDAGRIWGKNVMVYRSPEGNVCECCHPSICADSKGGIHVMWRNSLDGNRDMYFSESRDGARFAPASQLGTGHWPLNACPMDGGEIASGPSSGVVTAWRRDKEIFTCIPGRPETLVGTGEQPTLAVSQKSVWIAWLSSRKGELNLRRLGDNQGKTLASSADDPQLFSDQAGRLGMVWTAPNGPHAVRLDK